jgi:hypothetical protein
MPCGEERRQGEERDDRAPDEWSLEVSKARVLEPGRRLVGRLPHLLPLHRLVVILHLPRRLALVLRRHLRLHHELEALGSGDLAHAGRSSRGRGHSLPASTGFGLGGGGGGGGGQLESNKNRMQSY